MGENSKIEWTDHTFNPVMGCQKVSEGCKNCYAEEMMDHRYGKVKWGPEGTRVRTSAANWRKPYQWDKEAKAAGRRARVFCASLADVFEDHPDWVQPRRDLIVMMEQTPNLDWLLLTKRPQNVMPMIQAAISYDVETWFEAMGRRIWIGTSVENQEQASTRLGHLVSIPAAIRFVSAEPLLGPLDISRWLGQRSDMVPQTGVDWVIVGGESGPHARPMHPAWARSLRDQCQAASVPFFFKQHGEWLAISQDVNHVIGLGQNEGKYGSPRDWVNLGVHCDAAKVGKNIAGRLLDGIEWNQLPGVSDD